MSSAVSYDLQGIGGGTVLNAGASYTGPIRWIQVVNDAVLSTVASASGAIANPTRLQSSMYRFTFRYPVTILKSICPRVRCTSW